MRSDNQGIREKKRDASNTTTSYPQSSKNRKSVRNSRLRRSAGFGKASITGKSRNPSSRPMGYGTDQARLKKGF